MYFLFSQLDIFTRPHLEDDAHSPKQSLVELFVMYRQINVHFLCHTGIEVCRGATPLAQTWYGELVLPHSRFSFRQTKQNSTWQRRQLIFLQFFRLCSTLTPHVGQARTEGQSVTPLTSGRQTVLHVCKRCTSGSMQPALSQRSDRGPGPFHFFRHCQQNRSFYDQLCIWCTGHTGC